MEITTNYHVHTYRCGHAQGTEEDYIKEAIKKGIKVLGFSDHGPFPTDKYAFRMAYSQLEDYIQTLRRLKKKYEDVIEIKIGLEIEYDPEEHDYYEALYNEMGIEYLVLGQHIFYDKALDSFSNTYHYQSTSDYIDYAKMVAKGIETGYFTFVAHPDIIFANDMPWDENCEKACEIIIETAKHYDMILELNANGIRKGMTSFEDGERYQYPHEKFWEIAQGNDIRVLVNGDSHTPEQVYDQSVEEGYEIAKKWQLNIVQSF